jgi:succinyl-diaminopimelate desuccinylase
MPAYARLIEIFERLVAYQTVVGDKHAAFDCLQYVQRNLTVSGLEPTRYSSNGYESLVATTKNTKHTKLFLQAHLDVVPGEHSLFSLKRQGPNLIGRGAYDMKYAAACFLLLVEELGDNLPELDFGVMFTTDEENDGTNGVKYLLDQGYSCDIAFIPDGGDNWRLETSAKGGWAIQASASGKTAHGSRPWEGENAIDKLMRFICQAQALVPVQEHTGTTMTLSQISGGETHNQIPDKASATFDIRFMQPADGDKIKQQLSSLADSMNIMISEISYIAPIELDLTLPAVAEWGKTVSGVRGNYSNGYALSFGASDARYFAEKNIPAIVTRPDGGGHHSSDEWINEAGLYEFYECIKQYVLAMTPSS